MWKKILTVLGLTLAVCAGGCSHGGTAQENKAKSEKQQLVLWAYYETQAQREGLDKLVNDFNQSQKEYEASWEYVPMTGFIKGLSSAYTEDNLPDMAILDNPDTLPMIQLGLLEDITDQAEEWNLEKNYYSSIVQTVKYEDHYYGLPFNCNSTADLPCAVWMENREHFRSFPGFLLPEQQQIGCSRQRLIRIRFLFLMSSLQMEVCRKTVLI